MRLFSLIVFLCFWSGDVLAKAPGKKPDKKSDAPIVKRLPLVTLFNETTGQAYNWWAESSSSSLMDLAKFMESSLAAQKQAVVIPVSGLELPGEELRKTALTPQEMSDLAKSYDCQQYLTGDLRFRRSPLVEGRIRVLSHLSVYDAETNQRLAESYEVMDVEKKVIVQQEDNALAQFILTAVEKIETQALDQKFELVVHGELGHQELIQLADQVFDESHSFRWSQLKAGEARLEVDGFKDFEGFQKHFKKVTGRWPAAEVVRVDHPRIHLDILPGKAL